MAWGPAWLRVQQLCCASWCRLHTATLDRPRHELPTLREETVFTARPKIQSQSQIFMYC